MAGFEVEQRIAIPSDRSEEPSWLDEERLHEELHAVSGGFVEGEEENGTYVLLSTGLPLTSRWELVEALIGDKYETVIRPAPQWAATTEQIGDRPPGETSPSLPRHLPPLPRSRD